MVPQLVAKDGCLYIQPDILLIRRYREGDIDTIPWPMKREQDRINLACALFDEYEMGNLSERTVALPDGTAFNIDNNMPRKS